MLRKVVYFSLIISSAWTFPNKNNNYNENNLEELKIYHGQLAKKGQFPWQVGLHLEKNNGFTFCGGAIISDRWILTAAHCLYGAFFRIQVVAGTTKTTRNDSDPDRIEVYSNEWFVHDFYDPWSYENDIGLVKLTEPILFNDYVKAIDLATEEQSPNITLTVSGWGATEPDGERSEELTFSNVIKSDKCVAPTICTEPDPSSDSQNICGGDSGGALVLYNSVNSIHVGTVSTYQSCEPGKRANFMSTAYYRAWIGENTGI